MVDFLDKARQSRPVETLELLGVTIEVRGLGMGELVDLTRVKKGEPAKDNIDVAVEMIARCCFNKKDGKRLIPEGREKEIRDLSAAHYQVLNEAVSRVNGSEGGNLKATAGEDSSSG